MSDPAPRIGACRRVDVDADLLARLTSGACETRTLVEMLVLDHAAVMRACVPEAGAAAADALAARYSSHSGEWRSRESSAALIVNRVEPAARGENARGGVLTSA